ncbi:intercellular trafficking and secretion [Mycoblastus sanguinarius]|nr:intercellular trafficking and secretion [Mycoblastus sanguinarius]
MDNDFDSVSWQNEPDSDVSRPNIIGAHDSEDRAHGMSSSGKRKPSHSANQAGDNADAVDLAGIGEGRLDCTVNIPMKENDGTKDAYVSYLVTTNTDFASFQKPTVKVRRRFTDFVFLYKFLCREYPQCAVPPLPDKHKMEYVRGDRFGPDFTHRRAHSLHRFLKRLALHPTLRRAVLLTIFLESNDWNAHMRSHPKRSISVSEQSTSVFDNFADTFVNAFSKVHKPDKRFIEVREKADKLDEDLGHVSRIIARLARREGDLEADYSDLSIQFMKLTALEPGVEGPVHAFAQSVEETARGITGLKEHTDQNYLGSLRDMEAYTSSLKSLLKSREQKQLDYEGLTEYLNKASYDRDSLASNTYASQGPTGFIRSKIEDVRGVDHEQSRRERVRKLELQIEKLVREVEDARRATEAFDGEVVREVGDFERIKAGEFRDCLGGLADKHVEFYSGVVDTWERYLRSVGKGDIRA